MIAQNQYKNSGEVRENYYDNHPNNVRKPQVPVDSYEQLPDEIMEDQMIQNDSTEYFTDAAPEEVAVPVQQVAPVEEEPVVQEEVRPVASSSSNGNCFPKDTLTAQDLLPSDDASNKWAQVNPVGKGNIQDQNFLIAGHHIGVNTVGQSLRNANRQLRSEPANPQVKVSPWLQSTIDPDVNRKALEIEVVNFKNF